MIIHLRLVYLFTINTLAWWLCQYDRPHCHWNAVEISPRHGRPSCKSCVNSNTFLRSRPTSLLILSHGGFLSMTYHIVTGMQWKIRLVMVVRHVSRLVSNQTLSYVPDQLFLGADNKPHNKARIKSILLDTNTDYSASRFRLEFIIFDIAR
jgi:hypothetical protein